ncbi:MAG: carboxypeptidase-like regulatory domain-containing protein, partial [Cytophagaceae bacterium]|nr:carboxypeptidase-like regulatory domain-containing protein [Cytophagaceae bacterium]
MSPKKAIATLHLLLWGICSVFAQNSQTPSISGKLLDNENKEPIEFASVALYGLPDTTLITGVISNAEGIFSFTEIPQGDYLIKSNFVGYETLTKVIAFKNVPYQLSEPLYMQPSSYMMDEIVVTGNQSDKQITAEKTKVNVAQSLAHVSG